MARPTPSTAFFLCIAAAALILSTVADARYDLPDFQVKKPTTTTDDPILLLPSEKPAAAHAGDLQDAAEPAKQEEEEKKTVEEEVPLTAVRFRPINRHFAIRPIHLVHRGGAQRCHHGQIVSGLRPWTPRYGHHPYGGQDLNSVNPPLRWGQPADYKHKRPAVIDLSNDVIFPDGIERPRRGDAEHRNENMVLNKIRKFLHQF
ncbi:unnamed protein product [Linum trigynum]|uniref:Uncharacterized protein n=1 Tax=Linum trigynum TaxID=586398 RepID=A0AAV2DKV4_9ROSI